MRPLATAGACVLLFTSMTASEPALAQPPVSRPPAVQDQTDFNQDVCFFGGRFESRWFPDGLFPAEALWDPSFFENNFIVGGGYQYFFAEVSGWKLGLEGGVAARLGNDSSAEAWAGGVIRSPGFDVGTVHITPAVTGGFSAVTGSIGVETERAESIDRTVPILFYMGPEVSFSVPQYPGVEAFWRLQHRSGGYGIIAPIDGSNADVVGLRFKF